MQSGRVLSLMLLLLIAAAIPSCKSPNAPTPPGPTLTLILPDSALVFDTVTFRVHYSDSIKPSWDYVWQFGDSTKASSKDTSILHVYDSAGTYTISVSLVDSNGITIAKQSVTIQILARHFNLALLQSMPYVNVSWSAFVESYTTINAGSYQGYSYQRNITTPLLWNGTGFSLQDSSSYNNIYDTTQANFEQFDGAEEISTLGSFDSGLSELVSFVQDSNISETFIERSYSESGQTTYQNSLNFNSIPFKSESDTDLVFEEFGGNGYYNSSYHEIDNFDDVTIQSQAYWSGPFVPSTPIPYIIIRFHK
jgi:hypothetical protein